MRARSRHGASRVTGVAMLAVLAALLLSDFVHTDDGCAVEQHCLACRLVLSPADDAQAAQAARPFRDAGRRVEAPNEQIPTLPVARALASRGPPPA
jgi:hypothetical protein